MNIKDKANSYYNKLLTIRNNLSCYKKVKSLSNNDYNIKKVIELIINYNLDYLLTDGFLLYLLAISMGSNDKHFRDKLYSNLLALTNERLLLNIYADYIGTITFGLSKHQFMGYDLHFHIMSLKKILNEDERKLYEDYEFSRIRIENDNNIDNSDYYLFKYIMQIIASYCYINKCIDNYNIYSKPYLDYPLLKLEEFKLNGVYIEKDKNNYEINYNNLTTFVINNLDNKNKRLIR